MSYINKKLRTINLHNKVGLNNKETRESWLKKILEDIPKGESILDAGAGETQYRKYCRHLSYLAQDFGGYDGDGEQGLQTGKWDNSKIDIVSDIISIPVKDNSFDNIMCIEVFEHLPQPQLAIKEFSRIIKPNGKLIITAPFCSLTHFAPYYFASGYSRYFYEKFLEEYGFSIVEISYNGNYFEYIGQELRRLRDMGLKYSKMGIFNKIALKILVPVFLIILAGLSKRD